MIPKQVRNIIFWFFIASFFISAPLLILFTAGYRYNAQNGQFVRTGVISISSSPKNANISLNDADIESSTPDVIHRLLPGAYKIELNKEGYYKWAGETEVFSGRTTTISQISLLKKNEPKLLISRTIAFVSPNPNGNSTVYTIAEGGWEEIWLYTPQNDKHSIISRINTTVNETANITWSANGGYMIISTNNLLEIFNQEGERITLDLPTEYSSVFWHPVHDDLLYLQEENRLAQINTTNNELSYIDTKNSNTSYISLDASIITLQNTENETEVKQISQDESKTIALLPRANYTIINRDESYLLLRNTRGNLILLDIRASQPILLNTHAEFFSWNTDKNLLAYSNGIEINVYDPSQHQTNFLTRQSDFIESLAWQKETNLVIFATDSSIASIEYLPSTKTRYQTTLLENETLYSTWLSADGKTIYYYGTKGIDMGLFSLEIR